MSLVKPAAFLIPEFEEEDLVMSGSQSSPNKEIEIDPNHLKTATEQFLYNAWKEAENNNAQLASQLHELQQRLFALENNVQSHEQPSGSTSVKDNIVYSTDEEELNKETKWVLQQKRPAKKRKANSPPASPADGNLKKDKIQKQPQGDSKEKTRPKSLRPPPVIVEKQNKYEDFYHCITAEIGKEFKTTLLSSGDIKVNVEDAEAYRKLTNLLNRDSFKWYSFENKQTRPIKVMVKKLHPSCSTEKITDYLKNQGFNILSAVNILKRGEKTPLPMFMLTFANSEDVKKIYNIQEILGMKVHIEAVRSPKLVPQCKNCQVFGHTQKYCSKESKCVRCAGKHHYTKCTKSKEGLPKCVNCGENHPSNYRGCVVAKEIQKLRRKVVDKKNQSANKQSANLLSQRPSTILPAQATSSKVVNLPQEGSLSYSQVVKKTNECELKSMLEIIMGKLESQEKELDKFKRSVLERLSQLEKQTGKTKTKKSNVK